ncbi:short-chain dehydrogenase/reductase [Nocardia sp. NPDC127579]|uniref:short-chain dehydrogenase/reductase n=1 Tax=Nocardia sp. NPDC127579 TaxID=3345402 RepID=UPI00363127D8
MTTTITATLRDLAAGLAQRGAGFDVRGKVALITGGGDGIGRALARELIRRGARVVLIDVDATALRDAASEFGAAAVTVEADVRDRTALADTVRHTRERSGSIDLVIANAGVTPPPATLRRIEPAAFERVLDINLTGVFNTVHATADAVIDAKGHIVVVSSCAAFAPGPGGAAYMISKAGVEQLGRALRLELAAYGASAGIAYFGLVDTRLARATLDDDPAGQALESLLPPVFRRRISADDAARGVVDGIERRAGVTVAPSVWRIWSLLRGEIAALGDGILSRDKRIHALIEDLETRDAARTDH